jgi:hypothetical protein
VSKNHRVQARQRKAHQEQALLTLLKDFKQEDIIKTLYNEVGQGLEELEIDSNLFRKMVAAITGKKNFSPDTMREFMCKITETRESETRKQVQTSQNLEDFEQWRFIIDIAYLQIQSWFNYNQRLKKEIPCAVNTLTERDFKKLRLLTNSVKRYCSAYFPRTDFAEIKEHFDRVYNIILQASTPAGTKKLPNIQKIWHIFRQANIIFAITYSYAKSGLDLNMLRDLSNKEARETKNQKPAETELDLKHETIEFTDTENNILEALGNGTMHGPDLLKKAGYDNSSHYRTILSNLVKRKIFDRNARGYHRKLVSCQ